jgi:DNA-binding transcriptional ArsR family regulator
MGDVFQVLADATRRRILEDLRTGEYSVGELVESVGYHQPGVSRHLAVLLESGLVKVRKDGPRRHYSLSPGPLQELDRWLDQYRALWGSRFHKLTEHLEKNKRSAKP